MKAKSRGKGKQTGKRRVKDLSVSEAKARNARGGLASATSEVLKNFGSALQTAARGG
jgi:hypothetical protein